MAHPVTCTKHCIRSRELLLFLAALCWVSAPAQALPPPGQWVVNPTSLDFMTVTVGQSSQLAVSFTNNGQVAVDVTASQGSGFTVPAGTQVAPGQTVQVPVTFTPTMDGTFNGQLLFKEPKAGGSQAVPLMGVGAGSTLESSSTLLDFGKVLIKSSRSITITLTNRNTQPIDVIALTVGKPFRVVATPGTLQPGGTMTVTVLFKPKRVKTFEETLDIAILKAGASSVIRIPVLGEGVDGRVGAVPGKLNFKNVPSNVFHVRETWVFNATSNPVEFVIDSRGYDEEFFHQRYPDAITLDGFGAFELALLFGAIRICEHTGEIKIRWRLLPVPGSALPAGKNSGSFKVKLKANTSS